MKAVKLAVLLVLVVSLLMGLSVSVLAESDELPSSVSMAEDASLSMPSSVPEESISHSPSVPILPEELPEDPPSTLPTEDGNDTDSGDVPELAEADTIASDADGTAGIAITPFASYDFIAPVLKGFTVLTPEVASPGVYRVEVDIVEEDTGVSGIYIYYSATLPDGNSRSESFSWGASSWDTETGQLIINPLMAGKHTLEIPVSQTVGALTYQLSSVHISDGNRNSSVYNLNSAKTALVPGYGSSGYGDESIAIPCNPQLVVTTSGASADYTAPVLTSFTVLTPEVASPGVYRVEVDIVEEDTGVSGISIFYSATLPDGNSRSESFHWNASSWDTETGQQISNPLMTGKHTLEIPVSQTVGALTYQLSSVHISDGNRNSNVYNLSAAKTALVPGYGSSGYGDQSISIPCNPQLVVIGEIDIAFYASTNNPHLLQKIQDMPTGTVAVLDYSNSSTLTADMFAAIAGQDKTLILQDNNMQWVFNGLDIDPTKCKDINLHVSTFVTQAANLGFDSENTVLELRFPDNGELPGLAMVRIYSEYLLTKYRTSGNQLFVTYYKDGKPASEPAPVVLEGDNYATFQLSHNSTFIISATTPAIENLPVPENPVPGNPALESPNTVTSIAQTTTASPQTGDSGNVGALLLVAMLSAISLGVLYLQRKRFGY